MMAEQSLWLKHVPFKLHAEKISQNFEGGHRFAYSPGDLFNLCHLVNLLKGKQDEHL